MERLVCDCCEYIYEDQKDGTGCFDCRYGIIRPMNTVDSRTAAINRLTKAIEELTAIQAGK
jgi:hypothetical protein